MTDPIESDAGETMGGCGWEYDHDVREGDPECRNCGAELDWVDERRRGDVTMTTDQTAALPPGTLDLGQNGE